jgi:hypothetical protein
MAGRALRTESENEESRDGFVAASSSLVGGADATLRFPALRVNTFEPIDTRPQQARHIGRAVGSRNCCLGRE